MAVDWTANEPELRRMVAQGWPMERIAEAFGTTRGCVGTAIYRRGIRYSPEHIEANRLAAIRANAKRTEYRDLMSERQKAAQQKRPELVNLRIKALRSVTPEQRKAAGRKCSESRLAHVPPPFRDDYRTMIRKQVPKAEAMAMLRPRINAWMGTHEGRLWRVQQGASLAPNAKVSRPMGYVPTEYCGAMS